MFADSSTVSLAGFVRECTDGKISSRETSGTTNPAVSIKLVYGYTIYSVGANCVRPPQTAIRFIKRKCEHSKNVVFALFIICCSHSTKIIRVILSGGERSEPESKFCEVEKREAL